MCIVFYTLSQPGYKLILLSNRDEYFDRPALPAQWHHFSQGSSSSSSASPTTHSGRPWVLSGLDKGSKVNGTWLGLTKDLRIGVITNIRLPIPGAPKPPSLSPNPPSRGLLLRDYLAPSPAAARPVKEYLNSHLSSAGSYDGFNLLLFRFPASSSKSGRGMMWGEAEVGYLANRPEATYTDLSTSAPSARRAASASGDGLEEAVEAEVIEGHEAKEAGVHCVACGLSNTPLDRPWPKVINGQAAMEASLAEWTENNEDEEALLKRMFAILSQGKQLTSLADAMSTTCLPPVRLGRDPMQPLQLEEGETGRWYGTRVSTVILVRDDGEVVFVERDIGELGPDGQARRGTGERRFKFTAGA